MEVKMKRKSIRGIENACDLDRERKDRAKNGE